MMAKIISFLVILQFITIQFVGGFQISLFRAKYQTSLKSSHQNKHDDIDTDTTMIQNKHDDTDTETATLSRRHLFGQVASAAVASSSVLLNPDISHAKVVSKPLTSNSKSSSPEREALLNAITNKESDDIVLAAIEKLIPLSPLKGDSERLSELKADLKAVNKAAYSSALDGEWKLLWYNKSDFSPLLKLPDPLRPDSYQYFGKSAEQEVGEGRVAQGLVGGVLNILGKDTELWLSSGAIAEDSHPSTLGIYPPFRFELGQLPGSTKPKRIIVESQSDAEFRAANARTTEAQQAPKNEYEQLYLESFGSGSLRISVVASGDPVIVGDMFVHQKL